MQTMAREYTSSANTVQAGVMTGQSSRRWIIGLSLLIATLALVATMTGLVTAQEQHHRTFLSLRGQIIMLQGGGLYANDSVSGAAQAVGQDVVTLLIGIPLLLIATYLASRGSLRGQILSAGTLWYFAYTYLLMAFGTAYNPFFLIYVALFSASIWAFILSLLAIDVEGLPDQFSSRFARSTIAWLVIGFGIMLSLLWLGRIVPSLASGSPPPGLDGYSTLFVQAGDLGLVIPLAVVTGVLLLNNRPIGYLLAGVLLVKGTTLGLALIAMIIMMAIAGVTIVSVEVGFFVTVAVVCGLGTFHLLRHLTGHAPVSLPSTTLHDNPPSH